METFLDISDFNNQVFVALQMAEIFTAHELEQLQFNDIIIPETRDINDPFEIFFDKLFQSDNRIQLVDLIANSNNRHERCMDIRIYKTNMIEIITKPKLKVLLILKYIPIIPNNTPIIHKDK